MQGLLTCRMGLRMRFGKCGVPSAFIWKSKGFAGRGFREPGNVRFPQQVPLTCCMRLKTLSSSCGMRGFTVSMCASSNASIKLRSATTASTRTCSRERQTISYRLHHALTSP